MGAWIFLRDSATISCVHYTVHVVLKGTHSDGSSTLVVKNCVLNLQLQKDWLVWLLNTWVLIAGVPWTHHPPTPTHTNTCESPPTPTTPSSLHLCGRASNAQLLWTSSMQSCVFRYGWTIVCMVIGAECCGKRACCCVFKPSIWCVKGTSTTAVKWLV